MTYATGLKYSYLQRLGKSDALWGWSTVAMEPTVRWIFRLAKNVLNWDRSNFGLRFPPLEATPTSLLGFLSHAKTFHREGLSNLRETTG